MELDKGCVEAAGLWYEDLRKTIERDGSVENPYDVCIFNKICSDGIQTTIALQVNDSVVSNVHESNLDAFHTYLKEVYKETRVVKSRVLDYIGMLFDFTKRGEKSKSNHGWLREFQGDVLSSVTDTLRCAIVEESAWFHSMTAKVLGGPYSHRSRHINIRRLGLCEKVDDGEVIVEHLGTEQMFVNVLTKPVQGAQFIREHGQLTNWM